VAWRGDPSHIESVSSCFTVCYKIDFEQYMMPFDALISSALVRFLLGGADDPPMRGFSAAAARSGASGSRW
jgi:hypothetical protein